MQFAYRNPAKNALRSSTNSSGCSSAAKCPPRGMIVYRWTLNSMSAQLLGRRARAPWRGIRTFGRPNEGHDKPQTSRRRAALAECDPSSSRRS